MGKNPTNLNRLAGFLNHQPVPTGSLETETISIFHVICFHLQDFPLKKTEISRFAGGKNPISQDHHALLVHSFSSASTTHLEGMDGVYYIHSAPQLNSVGSFFPAIPSKLRFFPNRLRFANIYCSLFQGVIWWFFP